MKTSQTVNTYPGINRCMSLLQTWNGEIVLNCTKERGKIVHLVSYSLLHNLTWLFAKTGISRRGFLAALHNTHIDQYGAPESDLLPWSDMKKSTVLPKI